MTEVELRSLARAAATSAVAATWELLTFAQEGDLASNGPFRDEPIEQLCDAAKMAIEIERERGPIDDERGQVYAALCKYLEGWAG